MIGVVYQIWCLAGSSGTLYDHWSADLASTADCYPGGMMMPGRNTEYSWSRMGYNGQAKDDEVYGKGNLNTAKFWEMDTRIIRRWNLDPVDQISISNYAVFANNSIMNVDVNGDVIDPWYKKSSQKEFTIPGNGGLKSNFKSFIDQDNLTNFGTSVINLVSSNVIFAQVYNQLSTSKTHYKVQQYNQTSINTEAAYVPESKEIKLFYFGASDAGIFEEFLHAGQDDYYSNNGISRSSLADEVEAKAANLVSGYPDASANKNNYSSITNYFKTGNKDKNYDKQVGQLIDEVYDSYSKANGENWAKDNKKSSVDKKTVFKYLETMTTQKQKK
ncbi:MAG: hypothetical protein QM535_21885 [Limnohabitans sp.]|nr:hypothetical protein [Limnohabitans sp.]